jgi:hypothetical protein
METDRKNKKKGLMIVIVYSIRVSSTISFHYASGMHQDLRLGKERGDTESTAILPSRMLQWVIDYDPPTPVLLPPDDFVCMASVRNPGPVR